MRAVVQRVESARVQVGDQTVGQIGPGLLVYLGIGRGDAEAQVRYMCEKIAGLRIFEDDRLQMNLSVRDVGGSVLLVSQFTLYGDARRGKRPSFIEAAPPEDANRLFELAVQTLKEQVACVQTGVFQAKMEVFSQNHGPVNILLDSEKQF